MRPHLSQPLVAMSVPIALAMSWLATSACDNKPAEGKPKAAVEELTPSPQAAAQPATPAPELPSYTFSQDNSKVEFIGAKVTGKHLGAFHAFSGAIHALPDTADPTAGSVHVEIEIGSLKADVNKLTEHLKSPELLDAQAYPKATFHSTRVEKQEGSSYSVTGSFELHGVTKQITFPAKIRVAPERVEADAEFAIDRKDFGIVYPGKPDDLIQDEVLIKLMIRAPRASS